MNRTLIYARVSTEDQLEKYGLPLQLRACRDYALAHTLDVIEEITDDGISGMVLERSGLARLRQSVRDGSADVIVMLDVDRLSRDLAHLLILKPEIEKKARLEFVNAKFEDSPSGRMFFGIRGVIAQYERELTRERTMRGKRERALAGKVVGGRVAYGYRYEDGRLIPDEGRAAIVRQMFSWYESGLSIRGLATRLREKGLPTWSGRPWGHSSVRRILINETYAGVAHYGTHRREGTLLRLREPSERISLSVPALVPREQWQRVQVRLASNPQTGRPSDAYLLRGLLHCSHCGRRMCGEHDRRSYLSYRCAGRDRLRFGGSEKCRVSVNARKVDRAVWGAIEGAFTDLDFLRGLIAQHQKELQEPDSGKLEALRRQARKARAKEEICLASLLDPDLAGSRTEIKAEHRKAQQLRQQSDLELRRLESARFIALSEQQLVDDTAGLLRDYIPSLKTLKARQEFVRGLITRAEWNGEEVTLECVLAPRNAVFYGTEPGSTRAGYAQFPGLQLILKARLAA